MIHILIFDIFLIVANYFIIKNVLKEKKKINKSTKNLFGLLTILNLIQLLHSIFYIKN